MSPAPTRINNGFRQGSQPHAEAPDASMGNLVRVLCRHKWKSGFFALTTLVLTAAAIKYWPRAYVSNAKLFVNVGRESIGVDPTALTGATVDVRGRSRETELNSILEIVGSRELASRVVDKIGLDALAGETTDSKKKNAANKDDSLISQALRQFQKLKNKASMDPVSRREKAITKVLGALRVSAGESDVVSLGYTANSPDLAQKLCQATVKEFLATHTRVHRTKGTREFFEKQTKITQEKLDVARETLHKTLNDAGILSVEGRLAGLQSQIDFTELKILEANTSMAASAASKQKVLHEHLGKLKSDYEAVRSIARAVGEQEREVALYESQLNEYLQKQEQVRVDSELARDAITNVNVVQQPTFVERPTQPKKPQLMVAGLFLALTGGLGLAFAAEFFDQSLRAPQELERALEVPVLATIPVTRHHMLS